MQRLSKLAVITLVMMVIAAPTFALETKISGFYQFMAAIDNHEASNNYIGTFTENAHSEKLVDQRLRLKLDGKVNDSLSFVYYGEVDFQWGDNSYTTARNDGGAVGGDTVNLETKNAYIDVKFQDDVTARFGLQGFYDRLDQVFFATDMSGVKVDFKAGAIDLTAGMFNLIENDYAKSDNLYLWALQASFPAQGNLSLGADYYYFQNRGPATYWNTIGTADMDAVLDGVGTWSATRMDMDLHYLGLKGDFKVSEETSVNGWLFYNTGTVEDPAGDTDVDGYAASVRGTFKLGSADAAARIFYFSGDDDLSDGDASFFVNPLATESYAFGDDGFMIFLQDVNWANIGQYGFALTDAAYAGYGLLGGNFTLAMKPADKVDFKCGLGYFASQEDVLAAADPRTDRAGTTLGTEVFVRAGYTFENNLNLSLNGSYAALGDFYDNAGGGTAVNTPVADIDDPYLVYLLAQLSF